ncbi:MAG: hypothetical protein WBG19_08250 [Thermoplasmata archaeon]
MLGFGGGDWTEDGTGGSFEYNGTGGYSLIAQPNPPSPALSMNWSVTLTHHLIE